MVDSLDGEMSTLRVSYVEQAVDSAFGPKTVASEGDVPSKMFDPGHLKHPPALAKARLNHSFNINDLSSDSDLSDLPEDIGPDPFKLPTSKAKNADYRKDIDDLSRLVTRYEEAHLTTSFVRQVETHAELELFLENVGNKWPKDALGADMKRTLKDVSKRYPNRSRDPGGIWKDDTFSIADDTDTSNDRLFGEISSSVDDTENAILRDDFFCPYVTIYDCDRSFETETEAIIHSTVHTASSGKYLCPHAGMYKCSRTFARASDAARHGDTVHLKIKRYPCPHAEEYGCPRAFTQKSHAIAHGRTHTEERPYPCPYAEDCSCRKAFAKLNNAIRHGRTHTGEKPYPCPYAEEHGCPRAFARKEYATAHGRTHARRKPYRCQHARKYACSRTFATRGDASAHGKTHIKKGNMQDDDSTEYSDDGEHADDEDDR